KGPSTINTTGHYGTKGIPDSANYPGARDFHSATWTDLQGNLWLYGGFYGGLFSDLWKYEISTNVWTWIAGDSIRNLLPVYGVQGIPDVNNSPGGRIESTAAWTDNTGDLWLFGGETLDG